MDEERYERIKASFGMWMYESFESVLHVTHYNYAKISIKKFTQSELVDMGIAIFNKRADLELARKKETEVA